MRILTYFFATTLLFTACKSTEKAPTKIAASTEKEPAKNEVDVKEVIVEAKRQTTEKPDFSVLEWDINRDTLTAVVRYSGGCKQHNFNAYFSGAWLKSLPAQAIIDLEHINLENDPCRSLIKDTLKFDITALQYPGSKDIIVKCSGNSEMAAKYKYAKK